MGSGLVKRSCEKPEEDGDIAQTHKGWELLGPEDSRQREDGSKELRKS